MSSRGRGRGRGGASGVDRSSSSSNASSRSSSLTNLATTSSAATTTATANLHDADQLMKQLSSMVKTGNASSAVPGAMKSTPKTFKPNLAAAKKEKTVPEASSSTASTPASSSLRGGKGRGEHSQTRPNSGRGSFGGANRGRNPKENCVQIEGIFQANPLASHGSSSSASGSGGAGRISSIKREGSSSSSLMANFRRPGATKSNLAGGLDGLKYEIDEEYQPRQIPIGEKRSIFDAKQENDFSTKIKDIKDSTAIEKTEQLESFIRLFSEQKLNVPTESSVKEEPMEVSDVNQSSTTSVDPSHLILMQFPDVLPCVRPSSSTEKPELASLSDLPDGFLGKLQIYRSGRCRLKLNDQTYLDVDIGQSPSFLQNVMVAEMANSNSSNQSGNNSDMNKLVCLGDIKHKLVVSLDVDHVLQDKKP